MGDPMKIDSFDHVVLTVKDIDATCKFYAKVLGMEIVTFGENRKGSVLWIAEDQPATTRTREYFESGKANTRFGRCLLYYFCLPFGRYRPPEFVWCKPNRRTSRKKWGKRADEVGLFP
jgi:catechol 2,3-dioxygenase-like lactoylglutathione lyase family enzyme